MRERQNGMKKPRIVIIDDDFSYVIPLQSKFIYEFLDNVEIEVITERDCMQSFFESLQKIDILIIDKKLYFDEISKHQIKHIFVLGEDEKESKNSNQIYTFYKYTNVTEIFLKIVGVGDLKIPIKADTRKSQIVLITSASGGTGKTTIALGMARALSDMYQRVLYIEASHLQTFQYFMDNKEPIESSIIYKKLTKIEKQNYADVRGELRTEHFTYMPPIKAPIMSFGINYNVFGTIAKAARESGEYDFIILDTDSIFDETKATMMNMADKVMIVTEPNSKSIYSTNKLVQSINNSDAEKYCYICNKYKTEDIPQYKLQSRMFYKVDDYVDYFEKYENMNCEKFGSQESIRKLAFLLL